VASRTTGNSCTIYRLENEIENSGFSTPLLGRIRADRPALSEADFRSAIDRVVEVTFGGNKPDFVQAAPNFDALPDEVKRAAREQDSDDSDVDGVIHE